MDINAQILPTSNPLNPIIDPINHADTLNLNLNENAQVDLILEHYDTAPLNQMNLTANPAPALHPINQINQSSPLN